MSLIIKKIEKRHVEHQEKPCSKCGKQHYRHGQKYCLDCHAKHMRDSRPKHQDMTKEQRQKANCRSYANVYKNRGLLEQKPCEHCGSLESQMHHEDYNKPLDVVWYCRPCHLEHHQKEFIDYRIIPYAFNR